MEYMVHYERFIQANQHVLYDVEFIQKSSKSYVMYCYIIDNVATKDEIEDVMQAFLDITAKLVESAIFKDATVRFYKPIIESTEPLFELQYKVFIYTFKNTVFSFTSHDEKEMRYYDT